MNNCANCRFYELNTGTLKDGGICQNRDDRAKVTYLCQLWANMFYKKGLDKNDKKIKQY